MCDSMSAIRCLSRDRFFLCKKSLIIDPSYHSSSDRSSVVVSHHLSQIQMEIEVKMEMKMKMKMEMEMKMEIEIEIEMKMKECPGLNLWTD